MTTITKWMETYSILEYIIMQSLRIMSMIFKKFFLYNKHHTHSMYFGVGVIGNGL